MVDILFGIEMFFADFNNWLMDVLIKVDIFDPECKNDPLT